MDGSNHLLQPVQILRWLITNNNLAYEINDSGLYKGIWYMSRDYMILNTTYIFLNRHALDDITRNQ